MSTTATSWNVGKFITLRRGLADLRLLAQSLSTEEQAARVERQRLRGLIEQQSRQAVDEYRDEVEGGRMVRVYSGRRVEAAPGTVAALERVEAEVADLERRRRLLEEQRALLQALVARLEEFLRAKGIDPDQVVVAEPDATPAVWSGPTPNVENLVELRQRIDALSRERRAIAKAPPAEAEVARAIRDKVESAAANLPFRRFHGLNLLSALTDEEARVAVSGWLCLIGGEQIVGELMKHERSRAAARGGWGLPQAERAERLADLDAELLELEQREETMVEQIEASGASVARRANASPAAVLSWAA